MAVLGAAACTNATEGDAKVDPVGAPAYRTSMSLSASASAATSSLRENERQRSVAIQAIHSVCETLSISSAYAVDSVNAFVEVVKAGKDPAAAEHPAVDALNHSADAVTADLSDAVPQDIRDALVGWADAARGAAPGDHRASPSRPVQCRDRSVEQRQDDRAGSLRRELLNLPTLTGLPCATISTRQCEVTR